MPVSWLCTLTLSPLTLFVQTLTCSGVIVAPTAVAPEFVSQACRGAVILSLVWFIYRWKTNVLSRALATKTFAGLDRDRLLTLDKVSSVALFAIGLMALAEASGVAVQSMLTVGGIGGESLVPNDFAIMFPFY